MPQLLGLLGCLALAIGVFVPFIQMPLFSASLWDLKTPISETKIAAPWEAIIILLTALMGIIIAISKHTEWFWFPALSATGLCIWLAVRIYVVMRGVREGAEEVGKQNPLAGQMFKLMAENVSIGAGSAVLVIGTLLLWIATFAKSD